MLSASILMLSFTAVRIGEGKMIMKFYCFHSISYNNVTDLLKPRSTIDLYAYCSACLAHLYRGSVLRNSV
jgi:hypothetical protein